MKILLAFLLSFSAYAKINGEFTSEFKRKDMDCMIQAKISSKKDSEITFKNWDEYCEDSKGNSTESSLEDVMTYEKISENKLKVTQGKEKIELDAKIAIFKKNHVHYNFVVDTEDGKLEINEEYELKGTDLIFSSIYILDGQEIINKSGTVKKK